MREAVGRFERIAFDTCILIAKWHADARGTVPPVDFRQIPAHQRSVPTIVEWEFYRDRLTRQRELDDRRRWVRETFLSPPLCLIRGADHALRAMLERPIEIKLADALVAATCIASRVPLLTLNEKDFVDFPGLRLIDRTGA